MTTSTDEMEKCIDKWEELTALTCEKCGLPGELCSDGWYSTLCPDCVEMYNNGTDNGFGMRKRNYVQCSKLKGDNDEESKENKQESRDKEEGR